MTEIDKRKKSEIHKELDILFAQNGGTLTREQIADAAMKSDTALHKAAEKQGLFDPVKTQRFALLTWAATVLRTYHVYVLIEGQKEVKVRATVSLISDRGKVGYRLAIPVLSDEDKRAELLATAQKELEAFRRKFAILSEELAPVFAAIDEIT